MGITLQARTAGLTRSKVHEYFGCLFQMDQSDTRLLTVSRTMLGLTMTDHRIISTNQSRVIKQFYKSSPVKIRLSLAERDAIWEKFKKDRDIRNYSYLKELVPGIYAELNKALTNNKKIQAAVFSECVYSQAIADKLSLSNFQNHLENKMNKFDSTQLNISNKLDLTVRYSYSSVDKKTILLQAGGGNGVDCALVSSESAVATMIEFKEPYARTSTPNLPKYALDGYLASSDKFQAKYPQFKSMVEEQIEKKLNIFDHLGHNVKNFSPSSIATAVAESYRDDKFAEFICTEDQSGFLIILPLADIHKWATFEGELRPSGRNSVKVWTPEKLIDTLNSLGAKIKGKIVEIPTENLEPRTARGGENMSGLKITPLFWVKIQDVTFEGKISSFNIDRVKQHVPDITAKVDFTEVRIENLEKYYLGIN